MKPDYLLFKIHGNNVFVSYLRRIHVEGVWLYFVSVQAEILQ